MRNWLVVAVLAVVVGCGGSGKKDPAGPPIGESQAGGGGGEGGGGEGGEEGEGPGVVGGEVVPPDAGLPDAAPPRAPVTFMIKNEGKTDLTFALDKGWAGAVFAYSGKPPKAKPLQVFAKACTGACDGSTGEVCPVCTEADDPSERQKQEKAETKREIVTPDGTFELPWDGLTVTYEKAPKEVRAQSPKTKKCECYKLGPPEPGSYTFKVCALRTASDVGQTSKFECVEATIDLPVAPGQTIDVPLSFTGKSK